MTKIKSTLWANLLWTVIGVVIISSVIAWAGISNFGSLTLSDNLIVTGTTTLTGATTFGTAISSATITTLTSTNPVIVGSDSLIHSISFVADSMGADGEVPIGIWTPAAAVRVLRFDAFIFPVLDSVQAASSSAGDTCSVYLRSGSTVTAKVLTIPNSGVSGSYSTPFTIAKLTACTVFVTDATWLGESGDASHDGTTNIVFQYLVD